MGWFDRFTGKRKAQASAKRRGWWETAAEFNPAENLSSSFDPLGSYTGYAANGETPEQDADDM